MNNQRRSVWREFKDTVDSMQNKVYCYLLMGQLKLKSFDPTLNFHQDKLFAHSSVASDPRCKTSRHDVMNRYDSNSGHRPVRPTSSCQQDYGKGQQLIDILVGLG